MVPWRNEINDPIPEVDWDSRREGRVWEDGEVRARYALSPERIELVAGQIFGTERDRMMMLGLLLENVGVDAVVRLGIPEVWREAIARLET
jgi:hypothetical protein